MPTRRQIGRSCSIYAITQHLDRMRPPIAPADPNSRSMAASSHRPTPRCSIKALRKSHHSRLLQTKRGGQLHPTSVSAAPPTAPPDTSPTTAHRHDPLAAPICKVHTAALQRRKKTNIHVSFHHSGARRTLPLPKSFTSLRHCASTTARTHQPAGELRRPAICNIDLTHP